MVVVEQSAKSPSHLDAAYRLGFRPADDPISNSLVTALVVIVLYELLDGPVEWFPFGRVCRQAVSDSRADFLS